MSHNVDKTKAQIPQAETQEAPKVIPLATDPGTLVDEWRKYQGFVAQVNVKIREQQQIVANAQQVIEELKTQGLQVVGQANTIYRILTGMGVDPNKYGFSEEPQPASFSPEEVTPPVMKAVEAPVTKEVARNPKVEAIKKRFLR